MAEIRGFWRNYHSIRWVGDRLVVRLRAEPTDDELAALNEEYGDLLVEGKIDARAAAGRGVRQRQARPAPPGGAVQRAQGPRFRELIRTLNNPGTARQRCRSPGGTPERPAGSGS